MLNSPLNFTDPSGFDWEVWLTDDCDAGYFGTYTTLEEAERRVMRGGGILDTTSNYCYAHTATRVDSSGVEFTYRVTHVLGRNWNPQQGPLILWDSDPDQAYFALPQKPAELSHSPSSLRFSNVFSLCFFGKDLALAYIDKYDENAWEQIRNDRGSTPVVPRTESEAMRNAEHYLYARAQVTSNSYNWGPMIAATVGYNTWKFWMNVGEYYGVVESPWTYSINTTDELKAGFAGANDALFGQGDDCEYR